jgi:uncharacterized protein YabE (DUF348 family)
MKKQKRLIFIGHNHCRRLINRRLSIRAMVLVMTLLLVLTASILADNRPFSLAGQAQIPATIKITTSSGTSELQTYSKTVIAALDEAGIAVGENDLLSLPDTQPLAAGKQYELTITRRDEISLSWGGFAVNTISEPLSMPDLLSRSGFSELDLSDGSMVKTDNAKKSLAYIHVDKKEVRKTESIPFSTVYVDDPNLTIGLTVVKTEGRNGQRVLVFTDTYKNGVFISRIQVRTEISKNPIQRVISRGTKPKVIPRPTVTVTPKVTKPSLAIAPIPAGVDSVVLASWNKIHNLLNKNGTRTYFTFKKNSDGTITVDGRTFKIKSSSSRTITMYDGLECCLNAGDHSPAINHETTSGIPAQRGLIATYGYHGDGGLIGTNLPFGAIVFIEGYGLGVVADIHGVKSNPTLLDACFNPGELAAGTASLAYGGHAVYVLSVP